MDSDRRYQRPTWREALRDFPWWRELGVDWQGAPEQPRRFPSLPRLLRFYLPYWPTVAAILGLLVISATIGVIPPLITRQIIDKALPGRDLTLLAHLLLLLVALHFLSEAVSFVHTVLHSLTLQGVLRDVRARVFGAVAGADPRMRAQIGSSGITGRIINDIGIAGAGGVAGVLTTLIGAFHDVTVLVASVVAMFILNPWLALIVLFVLPPFIVLAWPSVAGSTASSGGCMSASWTSTTRWRGRRRPARGPPPAAAPFTASPTPSPTSVSRARSWAAPFPTCGASAPPWWRPACGGSAAAR